MTIFAMVIPRDNHSNLGSYYVYHWSSFESAYLLLLGVGRKNSQFHANKSITVRKIFLEKSGVSRR